LSSALQSVLYSFPTRCSSDLFLRLRTSSKFTFLLLPGIRHPLGSRAHSFKNFFSFLIDCVVTNARFPRVLYIRFLFEDRPASVHTTNFERLKSFRIRRSNGFKVVCSFLFPGVILKASGRPDPSMNNPI